jgi:hypothetical protein
VLNGRLSGPDTNGTVNGSCTDKAGNVGFGSAPFKYDSTPPSVSGQPARGSDANGWFNHPVTVNFVGSDAASGIASCTSAAYSGPDTGSTTVNGNCTDVAGNTGSGSYSLKYDSTPPTATSVSLARGPDANGWYSHPVGVTFAGSDGLSGVDSCTSVTYSGPDSGSAAVNGTCTDKAGNTSAPLAARFKYDGTPPSVSAQPSRAPDSNGWYNHPLSISFAGSDGGSGIASCTSASYGGPDGGADISGSCSDNAGNVGSATFGLNYDSTPPSGMVGALARPPDHNGWYNHPVPVNYSATDATSGNVTCSNPTYKGPDSASAQVTGSCSDAAGNTATGAPVSFEYKATPPSISNLTVGVNDQFVALKWALSPDTTGLQVSRSPGVDGASSSTLLSNVTTTLSDRDVQNGQTYVYTLTATDDAGNSATEDVSVIPAAALFSPAKGAVVRVGLQGQTAQARARALSLARLAGLRKALCAQVRIAPRSERLHS